MQGHVRSIDALRDLRVALLEWAARLSDQTFEIGHEAQRALEWAKVDQPRYWRGEIAIAERRLQEAKDHLASTQATYGGRDKPPATEARKRVVQLEHRVRFCQQRAGACRRWADEIERAVERLAGALAALKQQSDSELPLAAHQLSQWVAALDRYADGTPPTSDASATTGPPATSSDAVQPASDAASASQEPDPPTAETRP